MEEKQIEYEFCLIDSSTFAVAPPLHEYLEPRKFPGVLRATTMQAPRRIGNQTSTVMVFYCEPNKAELVMSVLMKTLKETYETS